MQVSGRAVDELVASERGEPEQPRDGFVPAQDARILEEPAQAAARALELLQRILGRLGRAVEVPAPALVLDVAPRLGFDMTMPLPGTSTRKSISPVSPARCRPTASEWMTTQSG